MKIEVDRAQELCENRSGRPGLQLPNCPYSLCGHKATLKKKYFKILIVRSVSVEVKQH